MSLLSGTSINGFKIETKELQTSYDEVDEFVEKASQENDYEVLVFLFLAFLRCVIGVISLRSRLMKSWLIGTYISLWNGTLKQTTCNKTNGSNG